MTTAQDPIANVPPHDADAEQGVLGALLLDASDMSLAINDVVPILRPDDFYLGAHRPIYAAILALYEREQPAAADLVARELEARGALEDVGGRDYLASLVAAATTPTNAVHYANLVAERALARSLCRLGHDISREIYEGAPANEVLEGIEQRVLRLGEREERAAAVPAGEALLRIVGQMATPPEEAPGIPCGLLDLDNLLGGFRPGQLVVVAGRTGMGKTTFAINVARHAAYEKHVPTLLFSAEMSQEEIVRNLTASATGLNTKKFHDPRMAQPEDVDAVRAHADEVIDAPLYLCDVAPLGLSTLRSIARREVMRHGVRLVIVDYLQLLDVAGIETLSRGASREQQVSALSRGLKALARELGVPVISLSQLNRVPDGREDHRPRLSDLRESGSIENDADVVLLLFRTDYYARSEAEQAAAKGIAEIIVAKQRNGPTDTVRVAYMAEIARFGNLARQSEPGCR